MQRYWSTNRYDLSDAIVLEDKGGMDTRLGIPMTDDLKASYLTQATPPPAALIIADTDERMRRTRPFWSPPARCRR